MSPRQRLRIVLSDEEKALRTALMIVRQQKGYVSRLGGWRRRTALALESLEAVERRLEHHAEQARLSRELTDMQKRYTPATDAEEPRQ